MNVKVWKLLGLLFIMIFALSAANSVHAQAVTTTITVGSEPVGIAYDPNMHELFVANYVGGNVMIISDNNNAARTLTLQAGPAYGVACDSGKGEIFVTDGTGVNAISDTTDAVVANITVPWATTGLTNIAYDSGRGELFVSYPTFYYPPLNMISVISDTTNAVVANITCLPFGMVYDSAKGEIFASENPGAPGDVAVISDNTNTVLTTIPVAYPGSLAYDSAKGEVFVVNGTDVSVILDNGNKVVANINVGMVGASLAYDSGKGAIYVNGPNEVAVISDITNAVVEIVNTGFTNPEGIAYDSGTGEIFAVNSGQPGTIAVISDSSNVPEFSSAALILTLLFVTSAVVLATKKLPRCRIQSTSVTGRT